MFYLGFVRLFVAIAATVYQEPHFWRTEGHELLEFMGGSNLMHACSNYLICMHFI